MNPREDAWIDIRTCDELEVCLADRSRPLHADQAKVVIGDIADGLPGFEVEGYFHQCPDAFREFDQIAVVRESGTGRHVALSGLQWIAANGEPVLYIRVGFTAQSYHGTHATALAHMGAISRALEERSCRWVAAKSNNPNVHSIFLSCAALVAGTCAYPRISSGAQQPACASTAAALATVLCPDTEFQVESGAIVGGQAVTYANLFPEPQRSRNEELNQYFDKHVRPADQLLSLFYIPSRVLPRFKHFVHHVLEVK